MNADGNLSPSLSLSIYLSILSFYLSVCLSVCLSVRLSLCPSLTTLGLFLLSCWSITTCHHLSTDLFLSLQLIQEPTKSIKNYLNPVNLSSQIKQAYSTTHVHIGSYTTTCHIKPLGYYQAAQRMACSWGISSKRMSQPTGAWDKVKWRGVMTLYEWSSILYIRHIFMHIVSNVMCMHMVV